MPSPPITNIPPVRQASTINPHIQPNVPSPPIKSTTMNPDKIRPIAKTSTRPIGVTPIQSPLKSLSTASSINNDVPQIEINSPSPNSPGLTTTTTTTTTTKSKNGNRDQYEQRFGYDAYIKQQDESTSHVKSPTPQRKPMKASTTITPIKQRDHQDSRRTAATPINGNTNMNKTKISSPRHTSTSSEEQQHVAPPTPMKSVKLKEQTPTPPAPVPLINSHLVNKTNNPPRLFIALFDYDPNAMSPNKDNEEELPFKEGQLIRVRFYF
jgi:hypothetical protein